MTQPRMVPVKINAWVDEGIAELVAALSRVKGLETLESCQGDAERDAFVIFRYGDWRKCGELLFGQILPRMSPDLRADVSLKLQAYDTDTVSGRIMLEPSAVSAFTRCVREAITAPLGASLFVASNAHRKAVA